MKSISHSIQPQTVDGRASISASTLAAMAASGSTARPVNAATRMTGAEVSSVADCLVLCTGLNAPHLRALADEVVRQLRQESPPIAPHRRAGSAESEWLVLDYVDVVVHLFTPSMRAYYALEQLWKDAPAL